MRDTSGKKAEADAYRQRGGQATPGAEGSTSGVSVDFGVRVADGSNGRFKSRGGVSGGMIRQELAEAQAELPDIDQQIKALELQIALLRKKRQAKLTKIERYKALAEQLDSVIRENP